MSFFGALGQGLLGAVSGGAGAYVDETKRQIKLEDEVEKEEKLARIKAEIEEARAARAEEAKRKLAEAERAAGADRLKKYESQARASKRTTEPFVFDPNETSTGEGLLNYDALAEKGAPKMVDASNYDVMGEAERLALLDNRTDDAAILAKMRGASPTAAALEEAKLAEAKRKASGLGDAQMLALGKGGKGILRDAAGNIQEIDNPEMPSHTYYHSDGGAGGSSGKRDPRIPTNGVPLGGNGFMIEKEVQSMLKGEKGVKRLKRAYFDFDGKEYTKTQWEAKFGSISSGGKPENKQPLSTPSGNIPTMVWNPTTRKLEPVK